MSLFLSNGSWRSLCLLMNILGADVKLAAMLVAEHITAGVEEVDAWVQFKASLE